jgi:hypothetical protein
MALLDENVCCQQAWKAGFTTIRATSITANRQNAPQLDEFDGCSELLHQRLTVVDALPVASAACHIYRIGAKVF